MYATTNAPLNASSSGSSVQHVSKLILLLVIAVVFH